MIKYSLILLTIVIVSCQTKETAKALPYIGDRAELDGSVIEHDIREFTFTDQLGRAVSSTDVDGKIYLTDFFFTSCPSICPKVKKQMLRIYDKVLDNDDILLISHTIDPKRDTPEALKLYADNMEIDHDKWRFLTGDKEALLDIADDYFVAAYEDPEAPGGFDHSGKVILLDKAGRIRSFGDGTSPKEIDKLMYDIDILLREYE
jgi:protein SCO1/2